MIKVDKVLGNLSQGGDEFARPQTEKLALHWYEVDKKILRTTTDHGTDIALHFSRESGVLKYGDVLFVDDNRVIVVDILPCDAIAIRPQTLYDMGRVCYEIGNKHVPLFIQNDEVLLPYEKPMFHWLETAGFQPKKQVHRLVNILKSKVQPHTHGNDDHHHSYSHDHHHSHSHDHHHSP